ncbi:MAG TPA: hypothetical protein VJT78_12990 [Candidatus Dormibacteraeota bacterium]|nr:hypothetical protein [Candidatus Dormibacteraeota bacterium]
MEVRGEREDDSELQAMVEHWVEVIDRWVGKFDREMGGAAGDGESAGEGALPADTTGTS